MPQPLRPAAPDPRQQQQQQQHHQRHYDCVDDCLDFIDPKNPLPQEILDMRHEDTVCQYCGIPYLIHSEMSKMKKRVAQLEKELEEYPV